MPPKKAAAKGGKGGKALAGVIDGVNTTEMNREQLEEFAHRLREELEREREERNYFQLERDKIRTFWEITRKELEENRCELRNKDREIEEVGEKHESEIKIYKQKVKHLLYEHQNNLSELKAEGLVSLKMAQDDFAEQELELLKDKKSLKLQIQELELAQLDEIKNLKMHQSVEMKEVRGKLEQESKEIENKYEKKLANLRNELELKHRMELTEVEERKNNQIAELIANHEMAFTEIKNYYNDITLNNLSLINSLKEQMEEIKTREERVEKQLHDVQQENRKLVEPLQEAERQNADLTRKMKNYDKDKTSLLNTKNLLHACKKELADLKWENEVLELRFEKLRQERDELHNRFVSSIMELQQKTGLKNVILEKKLIALTELLEEKDAEIGDIIVTSQSEPGKIELHNKKLKSILDRKNATIQDLQYELARVCKAHDDLLNTYEEKLQEYGIPKDELGFTPLRVSAALEEKTLGQGPAGLVTTNM